MKSALKKVSLILAHLLCSISPLHRSVRHYAGHCAEVDPPGLPAGDLLHQCNGRQREAFGSKFFSVLWHSSPGRLCYITILDENLQLRAGIVYASDILFAILLIIAIFEACRRKMGNPLVIITLVFVAYAFLGKYIPGFLNQPGMTLKKFTSLVYLTTDGIFGSPSMPRPPMWSCSSCWALS